MFLKSSSLKIVHKEKVKLTSFKTNFPIPNSSSTMKSLTMLTHLNLQIHYNMNKNIYVPMCLIYYYKLTNLATFFILLYHK